MKKFFCTVMLCGIAAIPAMAQGGAAPPAAAPQTPAPMPADPLATFVKGQWANVSKNLIGSAEQMPETNFGMKLGTSAEVRTFGSMLGHVINANYLFCSRAKGEANPQTVNYETTAQTKAQLVAAMHAAMDYCGPLYASLTDTSALVAVTPPPGGRGPGRLYPFIQPLLTNVIHNNEEYGNLVGYFRSANLVPPSTAAANAAAAGRGN
jgi:hypothetical protein